MNLNEHLFTNNDCYKAGEKMTVVGLMLHSTGANNPKLSRYVPAWNVAQPEGRKVCPHGFIGKTATGEIGTIQTLPWNMRGWHAGGSANDGYIGVEVCEGDLEDGVYFNAVYQEAVEVFTKLCRDFGLNPDKQVICHSEGHKKGIASNHADVMHWFPKHGKSMDTFRADVKAAIGGAPKIVTAVNVSTTPKVTEASIDQLAHDVIDGKYGSGDARKKALGSKFNLVQARVNEILGAKSTPAPAKPAQPSVDELAHQVIDGKLGTGDARRNALGARYDEVQARVNQILGAKPVVHQPAAKSISQLADEVMRGVHGSGRDRMRSLGSNYAAVQAEINRRMRK